MRDLDGRCGVIAGILSTSAGKNHRFGRKIDDMLPTVRHRLACAWLVWQLTATLAAPLFVWASAELQEQAQCQCGHGPGAMCPMHRHNMPKPTDCVVRSDAPDPSATLASIFGPVAPPPSSERVAFVQVTVPFTQYDRHVIARPIEPDLPPPRA
jgi:hypothetical protein